MLAARFGPFALAYLWRHRIDAAPAGALAIDISADAPPDASLFHAPGGIHGVSHARRVLAHALLIADEVGVEQWQAEALYHAALWHDIGRVDDRGDYFHGARSVGKIIGLGLAADIDPVVADVAMFAIEQHCTDEGYAVRAADELYPADAEAVLHVWRILKDADGLDRVRLGEDPDPRVLRFDASRSMVGFAWELRELYP